MRFSSKINLTYEAIKSLGKQSLSKIAKLTNATKSSVHRQTKKIQQRSEITGASFFETVDGAMWLRKLVLAATLIFGLQNKAGGAKLSLFFETICITKFVGVSESSMVRLKNTMMEELQKYQIELQPLLEQMASSLSITVGADETFFDRLLILVFMDLSSGFVFLEEAVPDRKALTWGDYSGAIKQIIHRNFLLECSL